MRPDLLDILRCPVCRGTLTLRVDQKVGEEIERGNLHCSACPADYPIEEGIPDLLPPDERA